MCANERCTDGSFDVRIEAGDITPGAPGIGSSMWVCANHVGWALQALWDQTGLEPRIVDDRRGVAR